MTRAPLQFLDNKTPFGDLCDVQEEMLQTLGAWKHHLVEKQHACSSKTSNNNNNVHTFSLLWKYTSKRPCNFQMVKIVQKEKLSREVIHKR
jgi:hypothetical protein